MKWFLECMNRAILNSNTLLKKIMTKARVWQEFAQIRLSKHQIKAINRLLDADADGFEGGLKNIKHMGIAHTSRATAQRELADLVNPGILIKTRFLYQTANLKMIRLIDILRTIADWISPSFYLQ